MPVPPPTSPSYFLPSHVEACAAQKGMEAPLAKAVGECSKESMSQAPAEAGRMRWSGPTTQLNVSRVVGTVLWDSPKWNPATCSGEQPPWGRRIKANHFLRNHTPQEDPWPGAWKCLSSLSIPGEGNGAQNPRCATKGSLSS